MHFILHNTVNTNKTYNMKIHFYRFLIAYLLSYNSDNKHCHYWDHPSIVSCIYLIKWQQVALNSMIRNSKHQDNCKKLPGDSPPLPLVEHRFMYLSGFIYISDHMTSMIRG